ncbi:MAG: ribosome biogenesis GTP-binding protein YihA/YsxC [Stagnimonas sp.]|nr:ribosome biogenesis GTP-binding protein YihA/YsxC [Stagnimonas sp.]
MSAPDSNTNPFAHTQFLMSCAKLEQLPADGVPELAFVGRSNAGKSSALNTLCQQRALARVSRTPGRTQLINLFNLRGGQARLVDLPGYGFAAVPLAIKRDWGKLIGGYLESRDCLKTLAVIMDSRHPLTDLDEQMLDWAAAAGRPCHVLLTKCDKLSRGAAATTLLQVRKALSLRGPTFTAQLFSSHTPTGVEEARAALTAALAAGH